MNRREACEKVASIITADRTTTHGEPVAQLAHITAVQRALGHREAPHLNDTCKAAIDAIVMKLSRLVKGQAVEDHFLDILGYAAIAIESLDSKTFTKFKNGDRVKTNFTDAKYGRVISDIIGHFNSVHVRFDDGSSSWLLPEILSKE